MNDFLEKMIVVCLGIIIGGLMFELSLKMGWI